MHLELIKVKENRYKLISKSSKKHPTLKHLGHLLCQVNKSSNIKIGIYNITSCPFAKFKTVYSYISNRSQKMCKKYYYSFMKGERQLKAEKAYK